MGRNQETGWAIGTEGSGGVIANKRRELFFLQIFWVLASSTLNYTPVLCGPAFSPFFFPSPSLSVCVWMSNLKIKITGPLVRAFYLSCIDLVSLALCSVLE